MKSNQQTQPIQQGQSGQQTQPIQPGQSGQQGQQPQPIQPGNQQPQPSNPVKPTIKQLVTALGIHLLVWGPIVVGLIHQFLMFRFAPRFQGIYVFVNPPGYIYPLISLEYQWWFVVLIGTAILFVIAYLNLIQAIPNRLTYPTYVYIIFLLIFVKPV